MPVKRLTAKEIRLRLEVCTSRTLREILSAVIGEAPAKTLSIIDAGLTEFESMKTQPFNGWEEFLAVKELLTAEPRLTESAIAKRLNKFIPQRNGTKQPNRSWVQVRVALAGLPVKIQEEYRKLWTLGKQHTAFRISHIMQMRLAHLQGKLGNLVASIRDNQPEAVAKPAAKKRKSVCK